MNMDEEKFAEAIEMVADKLGIAVERVFDIFVGAQVIQGILDIFLSFIIVVVGIYVTKRMYPVLAADDEYRSKMDCFGYAAMIGFIAVVVTWLLCCAVSGAVMMIVCPEYTAIQEIIGLVT
jgi:hypothetical protein